MKYGHQIALTRPVPGSLADCELTHQDRTPIDVELARAQHDRYESTLAALGCEVIRLPVLEEHPDSTFVEDTMLVLPEVAITLRPGAESRRGEVHTAASIVAEYRTVLSIEAPGTIDGGDVLVIDHDMFVGLSSRSNTDGLDQLQNLLGPWGYTLHGIDIEQCLHLKSAVTVIDDNVILCNPDWIDATVFGATRVIECDPGEPHGANVLQASGHVVAGGFPMTNRRIRQEGFEVMELDLSELAKAEGAVTCCSIILRD